MTAMSDDAWATSTDDELISRISKGDFAAFEAIYNRYAPVVFGLVLLIVGDRRVAERILEESFFRVWSITAGSPEQHTASIAGLLTIAHQLAVGALREGRPRSAIGGTVDERPAVPADRDRRAEDECELAELRATIRSALDSLPPEERAVIDLAYFQGLTQQEIADALGESIGAVKEHMWRTIRRLRRTLAIDDNGSCAHS